MPNVLYSVLRAGTLLLLASLLLAPTAGAATQSRPMALGVTPVVENSDRDFNAAKALGTNITRFSNFTWRPGVTQPTQMPGVADRFRTFHGIVTPRGYQILLQTITGQAPDTPAEREQFCTFTVNSATWARSLGAKIVGVQVWNEPNLGDWYMVPGLYAQLMETCYPKLHAAGFLVVSAGIAAPTDPGAWMQQLGAAYRQHVTQGVRTRLFDVLAWHPYVNGNQTQPWAPNDRPDPKTTGGLVKGWISIGDYDLLVRIMQNSFQGTPQSPSVPIWYDEMGFRSNPLADETASPIYRYVISGLSAEAQATITKRWNVSLPARFQSTQPYLPSPGTNSNASDQGTAYADALRYIVCFQPRVAAVFNFAISDPLNVTNPAVFNFQMGYLWGNGLAKPSWGMFQQVHAEIASRSVNCAKVKERSYGKKRSSIAFRRAPVVAKGGARVELRLDAEGKQKVVAKILDAAGNRVLGTVEKRTGKDGKVDIVFDTSKVSGEWIRAAAKDSRGGYTEWLVRLR